MRASRLVELLLLLQARGAMTAVALAGELAVSVRTVQRDVEALAAAGIPVYSERGRHGGYRLVDGYRARLTGLHRDEAQALVAVGAAGAVGPAADLGLGQALLSARLKLVASLPAALRAEIAATAGRFHLDAPGWLDRRRPVPFLSALADGVFGDLGVDARYRGRSGVRDCVLEPLGLVLKGGTWYLVAGEGGAVRGYRADRFEAAAVSGRRFGRPAGVDLAAFWAGWQQEFAASLPVTWVSVRARAGCIARLRRVVEPGYAGQVDWTVRPDPGGRAALLLPFENLEFARAGLLGFGGDVEVLAPAGLRAEIIAAAADLGALYRAG